MTVTESPLAGRSRHTPKPITGVIVERILRRFMAGFCVVFGAQALPFIFGQHVLPPEWKSPIVVALYGSFIAIAILGFLGRDFAVVARFITAAYVIALAVWPIVAIHPDVVEPRVPWPWYLCNVAMAAGVFGYSTWIAAVYSVIVPALYFVVRQTPPGGGKPATDALLESFYVFLLGTAVLVLAVLLRRAAASVDRAQAAAVERYGEAVREHATELARVEVDSIVHDGVLTTLLSAGKADTRAAELLAADMAKVSMERLTAAAENLPGDERPVALTTMRDRLADEMQRLDPEGTVTDISEVRPMLLPAEVAEAMFSAAAQALVNSVQHAGPDASRRFRIRVIEGVAEIALLDDGAGFDTSIPSERLGVRVSILERVKSAGGDASVRSRPGFGTTVTLRWSSTTHDLAPLRA